MRMPMVQLLGNFFATLWFERGIDVRIDINICVDLGWVTDHYIVKEFMGPGRMAIIIVKPKVFHVRAADFLFGRRQIIVLCVFGLIAASFFVIALVQFSV